jgi:type I restriction enzyme S subunit
MSLVAIQLIPDGYQQTDIGVIPEDWDVYALNELTQRARPISYGIVQTGPLITNGVRCLRVLDIVGGTIKREGLITTSRKISNSYKRTQLENDDLVIPLRGKVGEVGIIDKTLVGANLTRGVALIALESRHNAKYLKQALASEVTANRLLSSMNGSALQEISIGTLRSFKVALPKSLSEQTAIANALSDVDALLTELENLIAKKQAIKTATMQQLLTGKTRLPQFATHTAGEKQGQPKGTKPSELGEIPEDWELVRFGNIVNYIKGYPFKSAEYTDSGIRVVRVSDTSFTTIKNENPIFVSQNSKSKYKKWSLEEGNIIFTTVGSKPPMYDSLVGKAILVESHHNGYLLNQNAVLIKPKLKAENISNLLISHFRTERYIDHIEQIYRGNANQASITLDGLFEFEIPLPTEPDEQTAIATILSDMDNEIQTLEHRLKKTRQIKQGMMQELLTGRTRLPY